MALPRAPVKPGRGPAHAQIEAALEHAIARGALTPGDRLPSERELAERYGVSRMTLRQALGALEQQGRLVRNQGRYGGTFVAEPKLELAGTSALSDQLRGLGVAAGARVLSAVERAAEPDEALLGPRVYAIERVRLANGAPVALERGAYSARAFPGLLDGPLDGSLYELIRARYDETPVRARERLEPALARPHEADALEIEPGAPVMLVERTAYSAADRPLERSHDVFRGDRTRVVWDSEILTGS
ncbi:MAG TPA: GntR family transcriptional regulator [Gaiellaceae bacterium]|nr:GntR family transcriptional regulator [Gaiellaceae bacterium]